VDEHPLPAKAYPRPWITARSADDDDGGGAPARPAEPG